MALGLISNQGNTNQQIRGNIRIFVTLIHFAETMTREYD